MGLTESVTWEVGNYDIRVMTICPGEVATKMQKDVDLQYYNLNKHKMLNPKSVAEYTYLLVLLVMIIFTISVQEILAQVNSGLIPIVTSKPLIQEFPVPSGSHPHDVAPAKNGSVWYTAQGSGQLGQLDPETGKTHHISLGQGSAPHGVDVMVV